MPAPSSPGEAAPCLEAHLCIFKLLLQLFICTYHVASAQSFMPLIVFQRGTGVPVYRQRTSSQSPQSRSVLAQRLPALGFTRHFPGSSQSPLLPLCPGGGNSNCCSHYGNRMKVPQGIENRNTRQSSDPTSGNTPDGHKFITSKRYLHPIQPAVFFTTAKERDQPRGLPTDKWIKQM